MIDNILILLSGKSGAGKSTVADYLTKNYNLSQVQSYTTREKRFENEIGHTFVTEEEFHKLDLVAYTLFNGKHYGATQQQVEQNNIYIVDKDGVIDVTKNYTGNKKLISFYLDLDNEELENRMRRRGDSPIQIEKRLENDYDMFNGIENYVDYVIDINNMTVGEIVQRIMEIIEDKN